MDFIVGFPKDNGIKMVIVIVERFTKYAVFVATPIMCITEVAAGLFYRNVLKYFGVPFNIISDHDV
jgi:hypothetical protein